MVKKSEEVKERIIKVADELFTEQGYGKVNVAQICSKAGKAKGLFFYYFEKKENIVKIILERQVKQMSNGLRQMLTTLPGTGVDKMNFLMNASIFRDSTGPKALYYFKDTILPEWIDSYSHRLKDKYVYPIILKIVQDGSEEGVFCHATQSQIEIIYLGISQYMHKHYLAMADDQYYTSAVNAISSVLANALGCKEGQIIIK